MKHTLLFILLCSYIHVHSQDHSFVQIAIKLLQTPSTIPLDSTSFYTLPAVEYRCPVDTKKNVWHVADLNQDGYKDLIYSGLCLPYARTGIFLNRGEKLERIEDWAGTLVNIDKDQDGTRLYIKKESCCCDYDHDIVEVCIGIDGSIQTQLLSIHRDTEIPSSIKLSTKRISGTLRTQPEINDTIHTSECSDEIKTGNHLAQMENTNAIVIHKEKDWQFVAYRRLEGNYIRLGWVKEKE